MNPTPDDLVARWEKRNAPKAAAEELAMAEGRRRFRMFAFTRVDLMRATLAEAAYRTAVALGIPPEFCRAALVPDPETRSLKPGIEIDDRWPADEVALRRVFSFAFRQVHAEWEFDLAYAAVDAQRAPQLASVMPQQTLEVLAARVASWAKAKAKAKG